MVVGLVALAQLPSLISGWHRASSPVAGPVIVLQTVLTALLLYAAARLWAGNRRLRARRG